MLLYLLKTKAVNIHQKQVKKFKKNEIIICNDVQ